MWPATGLAVNRHIAKLIQEHAENISVVVVIAAAAAAVVVVVVVVFVYIHTSHCKRQ